MKLTPSINKAATPKDDLTLDGYSLVSPKIKKTILKEQKYECVYCGYKCHQNEVHFLDHNVANKNRKNIVVVCNLCHISNHLEVLNSNLLGHLGYLDSDVEYDQSDINNLLRVLWLVIDSDSEHQANASSWLKELRMSTSVVKDALDSGLSASNIVQNYIQFLAELSEDDYAHREKNQHGLFLYYFKENIPNMLEHINRSPVFKNNAVEHWDSLAESYLGSLGKKNNQQYQSLIKLLED